MPRNPNLVPTVITDVNGKTTTVHKKTAATTKASKIPVPETVAAGQRKFIISALVEFYDMAMTTEGGAHRKNIRAEVKATLEAYSNELLSKMLDLFNADRNNHRKLSMMIWAKYSPSLMDEFVTFLPQTTAPVVRSEPIIRSLHLYSQLPKCENLAQQDQRTQKQCVAILSVATIMDQDFELIVPAPLQWVETDDYSDMIPMIKDERIIDLLMEQPEAATQIVDLIKERHEADYELILDMLANNNPALSEGTL